MKQFIVKSTQNNHIIEINYIASTLSTHIINIKIILRYSKQTVKLKANQFSYILKNCLDNIDFVFNNGYKRMSMVTVIQHIIS